MSLKKKDIEKIEELETKITELTNNWKRALADYANLEKRVKNEREELFKVASSLILIQFLPILDNLAKAAQVSNEAGVALILKQLEDTLRNLGVSSFGAKGETFDPNLHEAIVTDPNGENNKITEVLNQGYMYDNKVLRPAKVRVGKKEHA